MFEKIKEWFAQLLIIFIIIVLIGVIAFVGIVGIGFALVLLLLGWVYSLFANTDDN